MRRLALIVLSSALASGLFAAVPRAATATPEPKGCPAPSSGWIEVAYVTSPEEDWTNTSLYSFLFVDTPIGQLAIEELGFENEEDVYFFVVLDFFEGIPIDRNDDNMGCANWIGGQAPGLPDWVFFVIDNNANA